MFAHPLWELAPSPPGGNPGYATADNSCTLDYLKRDPSSGHDELDD